jgi:hypothetical protein
MVQVTSIKLYDFLFLEHSSLRGRFEDQIYLYWIHDNNENISNINLYCEKLLKNHEIKNLSNMTN